MRDGLSRREFLRASATGLTVAAVAARTGLAAEAAKPGKVVAARGGGKAETDQGALKRMEAALDTFGGVPDRIKGKKVLIKINATDGGWRDANTSSQATNALITLVKDCSPKSIMVLGQEWGGWRAKRKGLPTLGECIQAHGVPIKNLGRYWKKGTEADYKLLDPQPKHWKKLYVAKDIFEPDAFLINLARLKSHPHCVYTGVLKNLNGLTRAMYGYHMVDDTQWPKSHGDPANSDGWHLFPQKLAHAQRDAFLPRVGLFILDANEPCFGWRGPGKQRIHTFPAGVVVAGDDPLAIDVYGCGLLHKQEPKVYPQPLADWATGDSDYIQFNRTKANYLRVCGEVGLGQTDLSKVDLQEVTA
jgi:uncharacterized protein (DUF362 family)